VFLILCDLTVTAPPRPVTGPSYATISPVASGWNRYAEVSQNRFFLPAYFSPFGLGLVIKTYKV